MLLLSVGILFTTPGCVFWRLNQFRNQLTDFPAHFEVDEGQDTAVITAYKPLLRPDDMGWLTGLAATQTAGPTGGMIETYHYIKQYPEGHDDEASAYDWLFRLYYNDDDRLETIRIDALFAALLTTDNFTEVLQPMKTGTDAHRQQTTGWWWDDHRVNIPNRTDIQHFFGTPYSVDTSSGQLAYVYIYHLENHDRQWNPTPGDVYLRFEFSPEDEEVVFTEAYKGRIFLKVDLRAERNQVELKRLRR